MSPFVRNDEPEEHVATEHILPRLRYEGPLQRGVDIASFYGFHLLQPIKVERRDQRATGPSEHVAFIRHFLEQGLDACTQPPQLCHTEKVPYKPEFRLNLEVVGTAKSIAEALIIHTTSVILREQGENDFVVALNSVGSNDTQDVFVRDLTAYCRKHIESLDDNCRQAMKDDVRAVLSCTNPNCQQIFADGPQTISLLGEASRSHFYEVLEYLDGFGIPYVIDNTLLGDPDSSTRTVFEIRTQNKTEEEPEGPSNTVHAHGHRYDRLAKRAGLSRSIPAVGVTLDITPAPNARSRERITLYKIRRTRGPRAFIIQLGRPAKQAVLRLLEPLRTAKIPVALTVAEDSLASQLHIAESIAAPALVILGHKEWSDGTAIVRRRDTRSQIVVPQSDLVKVLRRI